MIDPKVVQKLDVEPPRPRLNPEGPPLLNPSLDFGLYSDPMQIRNGKNVDYLLVWNLSPARELRHGKVLPRRGVEERMPICGLDEVEEGGEGDDPDGETRGGEIKVNTCAEDAAEDKVHQERKHH